MYRIKLMILWGAVMSVWLCKSLFAGSTVPCAAENDICGRAVFAEYPTEPTTAQTTEAPEEVTEEATAVYSPAKPLPADTEAYVAGVVAAEMPVYFPLEALKAQAVAARTYACREYLAGGSLYTAGQAYLSAAELKRRWGTDFEQNYAKIAEAVHQTSGEILIYDSEPALAVFCSASSGKTEDSENVWGSRVPYLRSVNSEGDKKAPVYLQEKRIPSARLAELLGTGTAADIRIERRSAAGYVLSASAGGKSFDGDAIRQRLGLRSADFDIRTDGGDIIFTTYGYGHGVGMSQYGACDMAENGADYIGILKHYYTGVEIEKILNLS